MPEPSENPLGYRVEIAKHPIPPNKLIWLDTQSITLEYVIGVECLNSIAGVDPFTDMVVVVTTETSLEEFDELAPPTTHETSFPVSGEEAMEDGLRRISLLAPIKYTTPGIVETSVALFRKVIDESGRLRLERPRTVQFKWYTPPLLPLPSYDDALVTSVTSPRFFRRIVFFPKLHSIRDLSDSNFFILYHQPCVSTNAGVQVREQRDASVDIRPFIDFVPSLISSFYSSFFSFKRTKTSK
ncbi:hypothetical protein PAAG_01746 [Paracoccidioides lutzii Pb01]|uniref:Uncharacterized protein n=1 Tax=Paracoccidioides lutzii (strain ATCC MYA-826 / Pb01) TaxID=502779 RepID=C1GTA1_PARBA|nr:hypothetical protein PAAG_01746 [Paracoccidioides lutzii Pb01]EEH39284.2 hypothetical protein PAAG_01746 [Paracoccidioides lutzii Pb01]